MTPDEALPLRPSPAPRSPLGDAVAQREIVAGQFYAAAEPTRITTVLGSCVAACLFDPHSRIGGMNHFMLPDQASHSAVSARYGVHAMELLIDEILKLGGDRHRLCAKVFGGASVLGLDKSPTNVARWNCGFVRQFLRAASIPLLAERLGGNQPLKVLFHTHTGIALVKALPTPGHLLTPVICAGQTAQRIHDPQPDSVSLY